MPFLDVYIGDLDDPTFFWDEADWNEKTWTGNLPRAISSFFPQPVPFSGLTDMIKSGKVDGKQVDWGAFVARVTKQEIKKLFKESYRKDLIKENKKKRKLYKDNSGSRYMYDQFLERYDSCKACIKSLDSKKKYALVATEL